MGSMSSKLKAGALTPGQELAHRMIVRNPGVLVADWDGKELEKPFSGLRPTSATIAGTWNDSALATGGSSS
jgi:hypothetical protein